MNKKNKYLSENIRNVSIIAHIDAGKTTTTERFLYYSGKKSKIGEVHDGNTTTDWLPEEKASGITIISSSVTFSWKNKFINLIDTPGHVDFAVEVDRSLRVIDSSIVLLCASSGIEAQTESVWMKSEQANLPKIIFINKMDKENSKFSKVIEEISQKFSSDLLINFFPVGQGKNFCGIYNTLDSKMILFKDKIDNLNFSEEILENMFSLFFSKFIFNSSNIIYNAENIIKIDNSIKNITNKSDNIFLSFLFIQNNFNINLIKYYFFSIILSENNKKTFENQEIKSSLEKILNIKITKSIFSKDVKDKYLEFLKNNSLINNHIENLSIDIKGVKKEIIKNNKLLNSEDKFILDELFNMSNYSIELLELKNSNNNFNDFIKKIFLSNDILKQKKEFSDYYFVDYFMEDNTATKNNINNNISKDSLDNNKIKNFLEILNFHMEFKEDTRNKIESFFSITDDIYTINNITEFQKKIDEKNYNSVIKNITFDNFNINSLYFKKKLILTLSYLLFDYANSLSNLKDFYIFDSIYNFHDDENKFFENNSNITDKYNLEEIKNQIIENRKLFLKKQIINKKRLPVFCGSSLKNRCNDLLLDFVIDCLPSSSESVRPEYLYNVNDINEKKILIKSKKNDFYGLIFKIQNDKYGQLFFLRIFSGSIKVGMNCFNPNKGKKERITKIFKLHANKREEIESADSGDIVGITGLKFSSLGETITSKIFSNFTLDSIKFTEPSVCSAITTETKNEREKILNILQKLKQEDDGIIYRFNKLTHELVLAAQGELQLDIIQKMIKRRYGVSIIRQPAKIFLRETIEIASEAHFKLKKQTGGRGQYAELKIKIEPYISENNEINRFESKITQGRIPTQYIKSMKKFFPTLMNQGVIDNFPLSNIKLTILDGSYHEVDSSELAFNIALERTFKLAVSKAKPLFLEPIAKVKIFTPEEYYGKVYNNILSSSVRGKVLSTIDKENFKILNILIPKEILFTYQVKLRSISNGRAYFSDEEFHSFEVRPRFLDKDKFEKLNSNI